MTAATKPNALDILKNLGKKAPAPATSSLAAQVNDPAIAGAKKDKNTVVLGFDPGIADRARYASQLKEALERAEGEFAVAQSEMRDYGGSKRGLYNDTFKANVTTVKVPYTVDTPAGPETRTVAVICSNKYSVQKDVVLGNKDALGASYERLFVEERSKKLKPNAEELIRGVFEQVGLSGDELENAMEQLFEEEVKVKTAEAYEQESKKLPPDLQTVLAQGVTRSQPGLKFD
jgi:hypothetical protein